MIGIRATLWLASLCILSACGGGGSGEAPPPADPVSFNVGGALAGLGAGKSVTLAHVDAAGATVQSAALSDNGSYSLRLPSGTAYNLRVIVQPLGQTCTVSNGTGTATADVNSIGVACLDDIVVPEARIVTGTVSGLGAGKSLVLLLSSGSATQETTVNADSNFQFPVAITGTFTITVKSPPVGQACTVANGQGAADTATVITVTCANTSQAFKLGGSVSGNLGVVALRNSASGETLALNSNGSFSFTQPVLQGGSYSVAVFDQSVSQTCAVGNGSGVANSDVSNLQVTCSAVVVPPAPVQAPSVPTGLTMTYGVKSFNLAWGTVTAPVGAGAVSYRLFEDADGAGPAASTQIGGALTTSTYTHAIAGLLHTRLNAQYAVQACNAGGCSTLSGVITPNLTQSIGYGKASNSQANDWFGYSVALSGDGSTLAVGAPQEDSNAAGISGNQSDNSASNAGAVYVFTRAGSSWVQQAYLKASNPRAEDQFGYSLSLSGDGNTLAVGAPREDSGATGVGGNESDASASNAGAAYVFSRSAAAWTQQAYVKASNAQANDNFGYSVSLSGTGDTLAVGAPFEDSNATGIGGDQANNGANDSGAVYVFALAGASWSQQEYLKAANTQGGAIFGRSLALSADGATLAVGAPWEDGVGGDEGAVHVLSRSGTTWAHQAHVKASNAQAADSFGWNLALSGDGTTLAVGAWGEDSNATGVAGDQANNASGDSGAVYVFVRSGLAWPQQAYMKASNTGAGDHFGHGVALSEDGNTLAVGVVYEDSNATGFGGDQANNAASDAGAVYLFNRSGTSWTQQAFLKASKAGVNEFGFSTALSADGRTLAVGTHRDDSNATGVGGDPSNTGATDSGAVFIY